MTTRVLERLRHKDDDDPLAALTDQERKILEHIAEGMTNRQIGEAMFLSNNYEAELLGNPGMRQAEAEGYRAGIDAYFAWLLPQVPTPVPTPPPTPEPTAPPTAPPTDTPSPAPTPPSPTEIRVHRRTSAERSVGALARAGTLSSARPANASEPAVRADRGAAADLLHGP